MAMTMALGTSAFAASGFEFLFQLAGGAGAAIPNKEAKDLGFGTGLSFDADISAQIGYMFQVKEGFGISVLGELGYSWDMYLTGIDGGTLSSNTTGGQTTYTVEGKDGISIAEYYHSFKLGLLPKFNIGFGGRHGLAIGIGGGVKIPGSGKVKITTTGKASAELPILGRQEIGFNDERSIDIKRKDITDTFTPSVIGYLRVTLDYYLFFTDNIAMNFGLYVGGAFGPTVKNLGIVSRIAGIPELENFTPQIEASKLGANAFEIGLQLGFRYGPKA